MNRSGSAPGFWESFSNALRLSAARRGGVAVVPWLLLSCLAVSVGAYICMFKDAINLNAGKAILILTSLATVEGLFSALSIFAMTQIQTMCAKYPFSDYLDENKLLDIYIFTPQWILALQLAALMGNIISIIAIVARPMGDIIEIVVAVNVGVAFYVFLKTWSLVDAIRTLTWHYATYERQYQQKLAERRAERSRRERRT